jgi:hypothetical protein
MAVVSWFIFSWIRLLCRHKLIKEMLPDELFIIPRWQIDFDRDQKSATIDQTIRHSQQFGHLCLTLQV